MGGVDLYGEMWCVCGVVMKWVGGEGLEGGRGERGSDLRVEAGVRGRGEARG